ncbi:hypothetical protein ACFSQT_14300 [Mesorhizobium calcicola]|uniref:Uncharacterized protein n=1 Tax=Mesorhizobium calcicola TaxID=1300310 RepID=A0ABW4WFP0_9HYPH
MKAALKLKLRSVNELTLPGSYETRVFQATPLDMRTLRQGPPNWMAEIQFVPSGDRMQPRCAVTIPRRYPCANRGSEAAAKRSAALALDALRRYYAETGERFEVRHDREQRQPGAVRERLLDRLTAMSRPHV